MVRYCIVDGCLHSDLTTLTHRFPKNMTKWQESLNLTHISRPVLERHSVCCNHFRESDYRNKNSNHLNVTAVPMVNVPESERRTKKADEPAPVIRVPEADLRHRQDIYIELEESGEKLAFQATTKVTVKTLDPEEPPPKKIIKCVRLATVSVKAAEEKEIVVEQIEKRKCDSGEEEIDCPEYQDYPEEIIELDDIDSVPSQSQAQQQDPRDAEDQALRQHYSKYSKEELIEFLVKSKVFLQ